MATLFSMIRDINGYNGFGLPFTDTGTSTTLAADVEQTLTVLANPDAIYKRYLAIFSYQVGTNVFVNLNATAAVPGSSFVATTTELNPTARVVVPGDVLHFITHDTNAYVQVSYYAIQ